MRKDTQKFIDAVAEIRESTPSDVVDALITAIDLYPHERHGKSITECPAFIEVLYVLATYAILHASDYQLESLAMTLQHHPKLGVKV